MSDARAIVTCALTGLLTDPRQHPVPVTPEEMAAEARRAFDAGAAMVADAAPPPIGRASIPDRLASESIRNCPETTTFSPGDRPARISVSPPASRPMRTSAG